MTKATTTTPPPCTPSKTLKCQVVEENKDFLPYSDSSSPTSDLSPNIDSRNEHLQEQELTEKSPIWTTEKLQQTTTDTNMGDDDSDGGSGEDTSSSQNPYFYDETI
ncbi:unnamed protein product [Gongylonema pulchrum]|uniref:Uncharacterized protein n=1 Tax=Gongylonema pulchrum TaxID=637853 RepID=A0A3P6Q876_9BILA|nr:unnamed protein product [Gongylonema pulchrum]